MLHTELKCVRMDDETIRVGVGLRLGTPLCLPHKCHHLGGEVDCLGTHGLSYRWSEGRFSRHVAINDIIFLALHSTNVPSRLEPSVLYQSDGRRPDAISIISWMSGKCLHAVGCNHPGHLRTLSPFSGSHRGWGGGFANWTFKALEVYSIGSEISLCAHSGKNVMCVWHQSSEIPQLSWGLTWPKYCWSLKSTDTWSREFLWLYKEAMHWRCWNSH